MLEMNVYQNNREESTTYLKWYPRVDYKECLGIDGLADHMANHNTPFSKGTIAGILKDAVNCIRELTLNGLTVKIDNLAIFKCSVEGNPVNKLFDQQKGAIRAAIGAKEPFAVKNVKLLAQATGHYTRAELNKDATLGWTKAAQDRIDQARNNQNP